MLGKWISCFLQAVAIVFAGLPVTAKTVTFDFSETGQPDNVFCAKKANVSYCDDNKYQYEWLADYILISDYDFFSRIEFTADPGTYFTPLDLDVLSASSRVWRAPCPGCRDADIDEEALYRGTSAYDLEVYDYPYLNLLGYRDGELVADAKLDPTGLDHLKIPDQFQDIDLFRLDLLGAYFERAAVEDDGYLYTCLPNENFYCNEMTFDNLRIATGKASPAPVPLPLPALALGSALGLLLLTRRRS